MLTRKRNKGFTFIELMMSLAIMGILMVAVTVALNASVINYNENEKIFKSLNAARQALVRMTNEIRTAGIYIVDDFYAVDQTAPVNQCHIYTSSGDDITYDYRSADDKIYLITNSNGNEYTLCDNVTAATFIKTDSGDGINAKNVRISITVSDGDLEQNLSAAAVVRRVLDR